MNCINQFNYELKINYYASSFSNNCFRVNIILKFKKKTFMQFMLQFSSLNISHMIHCRIHWPNILF